MVRGTGVWRFHFTSTAYRQVFSFIDMNGPYSSGVMHRLRPPSCNSPQTVQEGDYSTWKKNVRTFPPCNNQKEKPYRIAIRLSAASLMKHGLVTSSVRAPLKGPPLSSCILGSSPAQTKRLSGLFGTTQTALFRNRQGSKTIFVYDFRTSGSVCI